MRKLILVLGILFLATSARASELVSCGDVYFDGAVNTFNSSPVFGTVPTSGSPFLVANLGTQKQTIQLGLVRGTLTGKLLSSLTQSQTDNVGFFQKTLDGSISVAAGSTVYFKNVSDLWTAYQITVDTCASDGDLKCISSAQDPGAPHFVRVGDTVCNPAETLCTGGVNDGNTGCVGVNSFSTCTGSISGANDQDCNGPGVAKAGFCQSSPNIGQVCHKINFCIGGANDGAACTETSECPSGSCPTVSLCDAGDSDCRTAEVCHTAPDIGSACDPTAKICVGGANDGNVCTVNSECPSGACTGSPVCNAGVADCTLTTDDCPGGTCAPGDDCPGGTCAPDNGGCATGEVCGDPLCAGVLRVCGLKD